MDWVRGWLLVAIVVIVVVVVIVVIVVRLSLLSSFYVKFLGNRLIFLLFYLNWLVSDKAEPGSAGEQPVRNSLIDWNGQGPVFIWPFFSYHSKSLCLGKLNACQPFQTCFYK